MRENPSSNVFEALVVIIALAMAAYLLLPYFKDGAKSKNECDVMQAAAVLNTAIKDYGIKHRGSYPPPEKILGGNAKDELIRESILLRYPINPYSKKYERMKKVPEGVSSPGDFSYVRDAELSHEYALLVYGKNGKVYKYSKSILD